MAGRAVAKSGWRLRLALLIYALAEHDRTRGDKPEQAKGPRYGCGTPGCRYSISQADYLADMASGNPQACPDPAHEHLDMTEEIG